MREKPSMDYRDTERACKANLCPYNLLEVFLKV